MSKRKQEEISTTDSATSEVTSSSSDTKKVKIDENAIITKLKELDSCKSFKTIKEFEDTFVSISDYLFNNTELVVKDKTYRLAELEYYFTCPPVHNDPFSHCHDLQATRGEWYFHQSLAKTNDNNYKGGSYKGLDISIGSAGFKGGILIRSLLKSDNKTLVEGPSKCVDEIIGAYDCDNIQEFVTKCFKGQKHFQALSTSSAFYLKPIDTPYSDTMVKSARVGLTLKQKTQQKERVEYIFKPYRHCLKAKDIKKGKHLMTIILYRDLMKAGESGVVKKVETATGSSGLSKYFDTYEEQTDSAFADVDSIDISKLGDYSKDFTTKQIYELGGILRNIF
ncbi:predicted protein [Naegleria gruberi]|uniref:Predicted protein n=1 Tax=Naegleria gruberi TaxID=5762 RepID=D2VQC6_NAEGR|nr:uncharacterized protein NAEGRDRAFT_51428 [Naegleria gruberi]EFC40849.1 predicted protein [Naegleria gruberi]|eukprot:XP_002673593.1 predicted protein [Naegleria gruberi strain NEG-M]